jgi:hypothetical protein
MKMKIRYRIDRIKDGKIVLIPVCDEITIDLPDGETFESLKTVSLTHDFDSKKLIIEESWDEVKKSSLT